METYIEHHGILGQKWGVRRYQNPDGTLTSAGKQRAKEKTPMSAEAKKKVAKYIAGGTAATAAIALGAVYATNPAVRDAVKVLAKTTISSLKESKSKAIEVGKKATKTALEGAKEGAKEAVRQAPKTITKSIITGVALNTAKRALDKTVGPDESTRIFQANDKDKIGKFWKVNHDNG